MAGVLAHAASGEISLSAGAAKTVLMITAASNHRVLVTKLLVTGKGIVVTDTPIRVRLYRASTAGTPGSSPTAVKNNSGDNETIQTTVGINFSAEPTVGDVLDVFDFHPMQGQGVFFPIDGKITVIGGERLAVECLAAQGQTVTATMSFEE